MSVRVADVLFNIYSPLAAAGAAGDRRFRGPCGQEPILNDHRRNSGEIYRDVPSLLGIMFLNSCCCTVLRGYQTSRGLILLARLTRSRASQQKWPAHVR